MALPMMNRSNSAMVARQMYTCGSLIRSSSASSEAHQDDVGGNLIPSIADLITKPVKTPNVVRIAFTESSNARFEWSAICPSRATKSPHRRADAGTSYHVLGENTP